VVAVNSVRRRRRGKDAGEQGCVSAGGKKKKKGGEGKSAPILEKNFWLKRGQGKNWRSAGKRRKGGL